MAADTLPLFLNPTAGRGRAARRRSRIIELLEAGGVAVEPIPSRDVGDLETSVRECTDRGADRLVVAGGDGSVHEAVNGILASTGDAAIGLIPTGTGNDFAKACGIPLDWEHATRLLADRITTGTVERRIDIGVMNDRHFANGAGIGLDAEVTRIARSYRLPIGDLVYLVAILRRMLDDIATPVLSVRSPTLHWEGRATLASVSNGAWIGGMFHIAPMAANDDGRLELLIADPVTRRRIVTLLPKLMSGQHMNEREIHHYAIERLTIEASAPILSHLDGELQPLQERFEFSLLRNALRLL